jgi:hypothetical protein
VDGGYCFGDGVALGFGEGELVRYDVAGHLEGSVYW